MVSHLETSSDPSIGSYRESRRDRVKIGNSGNPPKGNLVEGDDIIATVISQANMVTNSKNWVGIGW